MPNFPINFGGREVGGFRRLVDAAKQGILWPWDIASTHQWEAEILAADVTSSTITQTSVVTIPASGFVSGRLTLTFSGGGLSSSVDVVADAAVADDEEALASAMETALGTAIAGDLSGVLATAVANAGDVNLTFVAGIGDVTVTLTWRSAELFDVQISGETADGTINLTISGGGLGAAVSTDTATAYGDALSVAAIQREADLEGLIATTLAGVLVSADDDATDTNALQFGPDIADVTITTSEDPQFFSLTFGGTETNGNYSSTWAHSSFPAGTRTVTTARSGGTPATNADLAAQHVLDLLADPVMSTVLNPATTTDLGAAVLVHADSGISGLSISATAAPGSGTLTAVTLDQTVTDVTPAGPTVTVTNAFSASLSLNSLCAQGAFPAHVMRAEVALEVDTAFGASRTITVGDAGNPDGLLGTTPVTLNTTGRTLGTASDAEYRIRYESGLVPTATIALGTSSTVSAGAARVQINWTPHPSRTATAA